MKCASKFIPSCSLLKTHLSIYLQHIVLLNICIYMESKKQKKITPYVGLLLASFNIYLNKYFIGLIC